MNDIGVLMKKKYKTDCFAYRETKNKKFKCNALNVDDCIDCTFYIKEEDYNKKVGVVNVSM